MLKLITPPVVEPIDIDSAKEQLRIGHNYEDRLIDGLIKTARREAENKTGRQLVEATYQLILPKFSIDSDRKIYLSKPPLKSVSSIKYYDSDNDEQTLSAENYYVATDIEDDGPGWIYFKNDLPAIYSRKDAVIIEFVAGYGNENNVPEPIKQWMMLRIGHMYEFRQGAEPAMVRDDLIFPYKIFQVV